MYPLVKYPLIVRIPFGSKLWGYSTNISDDDDIVVHQVPTIDILRGHRIVAGCNKTRIANAEGVIDRDFHVFEIQGLIRTLAIGKDPHYAEAIILDKYKSQAPIWLNNKQKILELAHNSLYNRQWVNRQLRWATMKLRKTGKGKLNIALYIFRALTMLEIYCTQDKIVSCYPDVLKHNPNELIQEVYLLKKMGVTMFPNSLGKEVIEYLKKYIEKLKIHLITIPDQIDNRDLVFELNESFRLQEWYLHQDDPIIHLPL
jgi:hypothetical protein